MPFSLRNRPTDCVGLDIDGGFLAAVAIDGNSITSVASAELSPRIVTDGEVTDPEALSAALKDLFRAHKLPAPCPSRGGQPADRGPPAGDAGDR